VIAAGGSLNSFLVTNGLSRIRSILIVPIGLNAGVPNQLVNPFSSAPSTTAPYSYLTNFNVSIAGSPHYTQSQYYTYEMFQQEILQRGLNSNLELGLGSGLISQTEWNAGYRYVYVDLSRKQSQGSDDVSKSIYIDGVNSSSVSIQYHIFVKYQKQVQIDPSTGQLIIK